MAMYSTVEKGNRKMTEGLLVIIAPSNPPLWATYPGTQCTQDEVPYAARLASMSLKKNLWSTLLYLFIML